MEYLWSVKRFARWKYDLGDAEPTKAQVNSVIRMCQNGTVPCVKVGREWRIDTKQILEGARNGREKGDAA